MRIEGWWMSGWGGWMGWWLARSAYQLAGIGLQAELVVHEVRAEHVVRRDHVLVHVALHVLDRRTAVQLTSRGLTQQSVCGYAVDGHGGHDLLVDETVAVVEGEQKLTRSHRHTMRRLHAHLELTHAVLVAQRQRAAVDDDRSEAVTGCTRLEQQSLYQLHSVYVHDLLHRHGAYVRARVRPALSGDDSCVGAEAGAEEHKARIDGGGGGRYERIHGAVDAVDLERLAAQTDNCGSDETNADISKQKSKQYWRGESQRP